MAVWLQTTDGKVRKYIRTYGVDTDASYPERYVTNCGREWKDEPKEDEECDHLDCAIYVAKRESDIGLKIFLIFIAFIAGIMIIPEETFDLMFILSGWWALGAFAFLIYGLRAEDQADKLTEFKHNGTITTASRLGEF